MLVKLVFPSSNFLAAVLEAAYLRHLKEYALLIWVRGQRPEFGAFTGLSLARKTRN